MKTFKLALLAALLLTVFTSSLLAGGFALSGIGSRAISMGGAFRGMANDPTAMYWNPAGLGFMEKSCVTLAGAGIMPASDYTSAYTADKTVSAVNKLWLFPNVYAVKAGPSKLHYGLGVYVPYGLGAEWDLFATPTALETNELFSSIGVVDIHPTVSYLINEKLSVGAGLSAQYGMITIRKFASSPVPLTMEVTGTGLGFGANFGVLYKVLPNLNLGISGKIPSTVALDGTAEYIMVHPAAGVLTTKPDATADLNLPAEVGLGISYQVKEGWDINLDFAHTTWSVLDKIVIKLEDGASLGGTPLADAEMNTKWEDTFRASFGTEYWMGTANALRCGFFYDQSPIPDSSLNPAFPDISNKMSGNLGYSRVFGNFQADVNFEHIAFSERKIETQEADNLMGTYNTSVNAFNFGLTYNF